MNKLILPAMTRGCLVACLLGGAAGVQAQSEEANETDKALVESLQQTREAMEEQMPGLSAEEIQIMQDIYDKQEGARQNPDPPSVNNEITILERGDSPGLEIMERFDTTLVFADRQGNPMEITAYRISDEEAATMLPLHTKDNENLLESDADQQGGNQGNSQGGGQISPSSSGESGPIKGLIITPNAIMRSTNITVMLRGQSFPIVLSLSTRSTRDADESLAYIQEMRLSWASTMPEAEALAGKFTGSNNGNGALTQRMVSLVQGVPDSALEAMPLEGEASSQVSLWHDRENEEWYLRLAEHIEPWNISIADRTNDGLRGFSVIRLNGEPPSLIGLSVNGQYTTVKQKS